MENNCCYFFYIEQSEKISDVIYNDFLLQLPEHFQKEIAAYKHWQSAQNSLLGKIILLFALKKIGLSFSLNDLKIGKKDRPFLDATFDFNISHSGNIIVVALIKSAKIGVDVEKHRSINLPLFKKYFDDEEWKSIEQNQEPLKTFFDYWTIKESAIKHDGRGVEILSKTKIQPPKIYCDNNVLFYKQLKINDEYSCAVSSELDFQIINEEVFLNDLLFLK
ncbi:MAG TPA: 4'-phosphopantetheinyl transferase superfamily protein [Chitinophagales bacterium]|nr:4'-phosphopantetheinyl transferase superfamily protein [Chitinophagales bacterium]